MECLFQFKLPQEANYSSKHWKIAGAQGSINEYIISMYYYLEDLTFLQNFTCQKNQVDCGVFVCKTSFKIDVL